MKQSTKFLKGHVFINTTASLEDVAEKISRALSIKLEKTGRFDEYEGYQCDAMGFEIFLIGDDLSKPRPTNHNYQLSISPSRRVVFEKNMNFEEIDISSFLEWALSQIPDLKISK